MADTNSNALHRELATAIVAFQDAVAHRLGMTAAERKCAGLIAELEAVTPTELADRTGLSTGAITGIVDRLERAGFAQRAPNPGDRRSIVVRPLNAAELSKATAPLFASLTEAMTKLDSRYSGEERALIQRHLADTIAVLRSELAKLKASKLPKGEKQR